MMACLLCRIGIHADVRYGAVSARWQGLGTWRAELIKLSHDYCNLIGSHNIPRLHTESRLQSPDVLSLLERLARETSTRLGMEISGRFLPPDCAEKHKESRMGMTSKNRSSSFLENTVNIFEAIVTNEYSRKKRIQIIVVTWQWRMRI